MLNIFGLLQYVHVHENVEVFFEVLQCSLLPLPDPICVACECSLSITNNVIYLCLYFNLCQTEKALELVGKFEAISGAQLDMTEKYMRIMMAYGRDLEHIRKLYQKHKADPVIPRNLPPVSGRIAWSRQLYRKIEMPMRVFKSKSEIIKVRMLTVFILFLSAVFSLFFCCCLFSSSLKKKLKLV